MNKLWLRLSLAFGLITVVAIIIAALLANYQVSAEFRRFVAHGQMVDALMPELAGYYGRSSSWAGVETLLGEMRGGGMGAGAGRGLRRGAPALILVDAAGRVVYAGGDTGAPTQLSRQELARAVPVVWQQKTVGYLLASGPGQAQLPPSAQLFLDQINQALGQAALIAGILGLLSGVVMARGLSAPLGRLAAAVRRISGGQLDERVAVKGAAEFVELAAAFNEMAANLQQAETLRRNLVADIAHELRTPLSIIQGNLQAILDDIYPLEKAEIADIYEETLILNRLISDLRELAQAEAGQLSLDLEPTELPPLVAKAVDLFAELAREKDIQLSVDMPSHLPSLLADQHRLQQVLHNLIANALRYTPPAGAIKIVVDEDQPARLVRVSVQDTGPGISAQDLPHVFDRFWRADKARSREQGGSGLGLAIARQLVEAHGGHIGVESEGIAGRGSCFWFTLPAAS